MPIKLKNKSNAASDEVLKALQKQFGDSIGARGGVWPDAERIITGIFPLDFGMGGGVPCGRLSVFYGKEGSTKSLSLYKALAETQRTGATAALIDAEHVFDTTWGKQVGLDVSKLIVIQPDNAEQGIDAAEAMLYASDVGMVGIDSIAALTPNNEVESGAEKVQVGGNANLITKFSRKVGTAFTREAKNKHYPALVCVNQIRYKIGVMFGDPETMPGGEAFKFLTSMRVRFYAKDDKIEKDQKVSFFKETSGILKKHRVPILGKNFEYDICIKEHTKVDGTVMGVGEVDVWKTVESMIKNYGMLMKDAKGYVFMDEKYPTIGKLEQRYRVEEDFRKDVHAALWTLAKSQ